jgi:hypothetical protein
MCAWINLDTTGLSDGDTLTFISLNTDTDTHLRFQGIYDKQANS